MCIYIRFYCSKIRGFFIFYLLYIISLILNLQIFDPIEILSLPDSSYFEDLNKNLFKLPWETYSKIRNAVTLNPKYDRITSSPHLFGYPYFFQGAEGPEAYIKNLIVYQYDVNYGDGTVYVLTDFDKFVNGDYTDVSIASQF